ncbi:MAG: MoaD/ThiS family protein [Chloroflexi bacterium]|nr:MoaD/ThiS family protein [Chloroflexota bacterium]
MAKVRLEVMSALAETLGMEVTSEGVLPAAEIGGEKSVRDLFNRLGSRYPRFSQIVFDRNTQKLTGRVIIFFNGRDLELMDGLETRLNDGDTLTFVPAIEGG